MATRKLHGEEGEGGIYLHTSVYIYIWPTLKQGIDYFLSEPSIFAVGESIYLNVALYGLRTVSMETDCQFCKEFFQRKITLLTLFMELNHCVKS